MGRLFFPCLFLLSCAILDPLGYARGLALPAGFQEIKLTPPSFDLLGFLKTRPGSDTLVVYIEGDGFAWRTRSTPSSDPTPRDPLSLRLAVQDTRGGHVLYLARPCQYYPENRTCHPKYWTSARYSSEVVEAMVRAVETAIQMTGAKRVGLVGYSGGGTVAALIAPRIAKTAFLVTVAANLAVGYWAEHHGVSPLVDSLDPTAFHQALAPIPQFHFVGAKDEVSPLDILERFLQTLKQPPSARWRLVPNFDHVCCWAEAWEQLMDETSFWRPAHAQKTDFPSSFPDPVSRLPRPGGG